MGVGARFAGASRGRPGSRGPAYQSPRKEWPFDLELSRAGNKLEGEGQVLNNYLGTSVCHFSGHSLTIYPDGNDESH